MRLLQNHVFKKDSGCGRAKIIDGLIHVTMDLSCEAFLG